MDIYFVKNKYQLHKIDRSHLSRPVKPKLNSIVEYDPRVKFYKSPERVSEENLVNSQNEKNSKNQWEHLKIEEDLFYKEINCPKNNNCDENEMSEIFEYLNEFCDSPKNCVENKNITVNKVENVNIHSNETGVENPWDPKPKVDTLENSRKKLQSILQKQNNKTAGNEDRSTKISTPIEIEKCLNLENKNKNLVINGIIEVIEDKTKKTDAPSFVGIDPVIHNKFPVPEELVMPLSIPKPRESSFERELRRLKEELKAAKKNNILDDARGFFKSTSRDRSISRESFSYKSKSKRKSRSRSRSFSPVKRNIARKNNVLDDARASLKNISRNRSISRESFSYKSKSKRSRSRSRSFSPVKCDVTRKNILDDARGSLKSTSRDRSISRESFSCKSKSKRRSRSRSRSFSPGKRDVVRKNNVLDDARASLKNISRNRSKSRESFPYKSKSKRKSRSRSRSFSPVKRDIARKNILDDTKGSLKSISRDRSISRESLSYKNKSKRKSRSKSRSFSPVKRKESSLSKSKYEKYHRRNRRSRSISRHRSRSFSRHRSRSFSRHRSRSRSRSLSKSRITSKSKSNLKIKSPIRKRSNSIENWNSRNHKPEKSPSFKYYEYDSDTIMDDEEYFKQTYEVTSKKKKRKTQAQDVYCDVCSIFVNTLKQYELHIESKKHKKKEKLKQALANNNSQEILQQVKHEVFEQSTPQDSSYVSNLVCEVCQMYKFATIDNFNAHMMSQKHKKNLVESMNSLSQAKLEEKIEVNNEEIQRNLETFSRKITEKEKIQIETKKGNAVLLVCTLCDVNSTSEIQHKYHLNSKRHLKNVAKLQR